MTLSFLFFLLYIWYIFNGFSLVYYITQKEKGCVEFQLKKKIECPKIQHLISELFTMPNQPKSKYPKYKSESKQFLTVKYLNLHCLRNVFHDCEDLKTQAEILCSFSLASGTITTRFWHSSSTTEIRREATIYMSALKF